MNRITDYSKLITNISDWMADYIKSSGMNWRHLVSGTLIMNGRTIMAMSQGEDIPLEDFVTSLFLGAWVMRKGGGGKSYDIMQGEMMSLRRSLNHFGFHSGNYIDAYPSGSVGSNESLIH